MGLYVHRISSIALHGGDIPALTVLLVQDALVIIIRYFRCYLCFNLIFLIEHPLMIIFNVFFFILIGLSYVGYLGGFMYRWLDIIQQGVTYTVSDINISLHDKPLKLLRKDNHLAFSTAMRVNLLNGVIFIAQVSYWLNCLTFTQRSRGNLLS